MRRSDKAVTDNKELFEIIESCKVCRIAMQDTEGLYIVPLNFGYEVKGDGLILYFHCAKEGRKLTAIKENEAVCFEMDCEHRLIETEVACGYGFSYKSIIGNGKATIVDDTEEKKHALSLLMKHQTGKEFVFDEKMAEAVTVFKVIATSFTGKYHK